jgi:hypothetical protein
MDEETYRTERTSLVKAELEQSQLYDRSILTLTAGALGLSLTFIHEIVPTYDRATVVWLWIGWALLILGLFLTLMSFLTSQTGLRRARDILDRIHVEETSSSEHNRAALITHWLNVASLSVFVAGVVCLTIFVSLNISRHEMHDEKKAIVVPEDLRKGFVAPSAPLSRPSPVPTGAPSGEAGPNTPPPAPPAQPSNK